MPADHDSQPGCAGAADLALRVIEAQRHADAIVQRVQAGELDAEGLALEIARMYGIELRAMARAIAKTMQGANDAWP